MPSINSYTVAIIGGGNAGISTRRSAAPHRYE
jgi:hypothetical protein